MSISIRNDILASIVTALQGISVIGGYNLDVSTIGTRLEDPESLSSDKFPALFVTDTDEQKQDADVNGVRCKLQIVISGYVKQANDQEDVQENVRKLLADVEKSICADRFRGNLAINTMPRTIKTDHGLLLPYGLFDFTFEVEYLQMYGDTTQNG